MNITQNIQSTVKSMPTGQVFGYQQLPGYIKSPSAVIKAVSRMISNKTLERLSKGKFYVPKKGLLGIRKPSDAELIRTILYKNDRLRGYVTGLSLYNQLGLTTQIPRTIVIAVNGSRVEKDFGTVRIKTIVSRAPIATKNVKLLQYLDVLKDIKKISDSDINMSLKIMSGYISKLSGSERKDLVNLAIDYYPPQTKALLGLLLSNIGVSGSKRLFKMINPTTIYKLKLDASLWPNAQDWNIVNEFA